MRLRQHNAAERVSIDLIYRAPDACRLGARASKRSVSGLTICRSIS